MAANTDRKLRYQHVYDLVLHIMAERGLQPGDRLPSTTELAGIAEVSMMSVRRALDELERAGKIQRKQGLGTFVAESRIASDPTRPGELLDTLIDEGGGLPGLTTSLITVGVGLPSTTIATALGVDAGQPVWEIWRRRSIGDTDRILERAVLPLSRVPAIDPGAPRTRRIAVPLHRGAIRDHRRIHRAGIRGGRAEQLGGRATRADAGRSHRAGARRQLRRRRTAPSTASNSATAPASSPSTRRGRRGTASSGPSALSNWSVAPFTSPTNPPT